MCMLAYIDDHRTDLRNADGLCRFYTSYEARDACIIKLKIVGIFWTFDLCLLITHEYDSSVNIDYTLLLSLFCDLIILRELLDK